MTIHYCGNDPRGGAGERALCGFWCITDCTTTDPGAVTCAACLGLIGIKSKTEGSR